MDKGEECFFQNVDIKWCIHTAFEDANASSPFHTYPTYMDFDGMFRHVGKKKSICIRMHGTVVNTQTKKHDFK